MSTIRADDIIDRQRLRRKVTFWRIIAFVAALIVIAMAVSFFQPEDGFGARSSDHVAKIKITGAITEDEELLERIKSVGESEYVKAVIFSVDSPGGTTAGGEAIYEAIRKVAEEKPAVAQIGTLAASAGYMVASATDQIVARQSSIVGSIGVIFQYPNFQGLLDNLGIDMRAIKSSPIKAEPSFYGDTPPEAEAMIEAMILDSFDWFKSLVSERRGFDNATIDRLADGSIFTGRQALENGLIDKVGGEDVARAWLTEQGIEEELETLEWKRVERSPGFSVFDLASRWLLELAGVSVLREPISEQLEKRLLLDGLLSIWHVGQDAQ